MSLYDYRASVDIASRDEPFYALIMAAMRKADTINTRLLRDAWPHVWDELQMRYEMPGGELPMDSEPVGLRIVEWNPDDA